MHCTYCGRIGKNKGGLVSHMNSCKLNPDRIQIERSPNAGRKKGCVSWNHGLKGAFKHSQETKDHLSKVSTGKSKTFELEELRKKKISDTMKRNGNSGGYRKGSGIGKSGWYKDFFCDSSYELAYIIYCLEHNIDIKRNTEKRTYIFEEVERIYIPDFIVNGELVEIKGYISEQWLAKLKFNQDVKVLYTKDLKHVFDYVVNKYGTDFISLYSGTNKSIIARENKLLKNETPKEKKIKKEKAPKTPKVPKKRESFSEEHRRKISENNGNRVSVDIWNSRREDFAKNDKSWGYIGRLASLWKVSHTQAVRIIKRFSEE